MIYDKAKDPSIGKTANWDWRCPGCAALYCSCYTLFCPDCKFDLRLEYIKSSLAEIEFTHCKLDYIASDLFVEQIVKPGLYKCLVNNKKFLQYSLDNFTG